MKFSAFIGPSSQAESPNVNAENTMNLYLEMTGEGGANAKAPAVLYGRPGIVLFCTLPKTPIRGLWSNATRLFAAAGDTVYEIFSNGTFSARAGTIVNDGLPVTITPNGTQLLITSGGFAYCDNGAGPVLVSFAIPRSGVVNTQNVAGLHIVTWVSGDLFDAGIVGQIITIAAVAYTVSTYVSPTSLYVVAALPGTSGLAYTANYNVQASQGAFLDGYFIVSIPNQRQINISAINDGTVWRGLDFGIKEAYPDNIQGILADHEELWIFGTDTIEVWQNTGAASFPLARIPGALIQHGCVAAWSPQRLANGVVWLSSDPKRGGTIAYMAQGFVPQRISTHAVETAWESYTVSDAVSFTYTENGHEFWVVNFPTQGATWVFDASMGTWVNWGWWNGSINARIRQAFHAFCFGLHLTGDWQNGKVYIQGTSLFTDDGTAIHWERTAPYIVQDEEPLVAAQFQLDMEVGQSISTPSVSLSWSDDGGHTFNTPRAAVPARVTFDGRMIWRRMGRFLHRIFRATGVSGSTRVALIAAYIKPPDAS